MKSRGEEEKSTFKKFIITVIIGFIPELIFSWIVGKIFDTSLWYIWIGLQVIKIFLWILRSVVEYLSFHLIWKHKMIDDTYASLVQHKYPDPKKYPYRDTPSDFFYDVMLDFELDIQTRLDAAQTYGIIKTSAHLGFWGNMRMNKFVEEAIEKYHRINFSGKDYEEVTEENIENEIS